MEKTTTAVMNEMVSTQVSDDIAFSILSKFPLKSFERFECVRNHGPSCLKIITS